MQTLNFSFMNLFNTFSICKMRIVPDKDIDHLTKSMRIIGLRGFAPFERLDGDRALKYLLVGSANEVL